MTTGPKEYGANCPKDGNGSTCLHLDVTSAVNILVWSARTAEQNGGALWHIFAPEDSEKIRTYLCSRRDGTSPTDPIHEQATYLTPAMLEDLRNIGVVPYEIRQRPGETVFIPAGCAHQVCTLVGVRLLPKTLIFLYHLRFPPTLPSGQ